MTPLVGTQPTYYASGYEIVDALVKAGILPEGASLVSIEIGVDDIIPEAVIRVPLPLGFLASLGEVAASIDAKTKAAFKDNAH